MPKKALRRQQQARARLRHIRIVWRYCPWPWSGTPFHSLAEPGRFWCSEYRRKPWQQVSRCTMNGEPKAWQKWTNLQPSRARQNQLLRDVNRGIAPDLIARWPDYRKPHQYFW